MNSNQDYVSLETAKLLKEKSYTEVCEKSYFHHYRIKDEILEKYPGRSDDGYRELIEIDGLKNDEVYGYYDELVDSPSSNRVSWPKSENFIASAPTLHAVQKWLRIEHHINAYIEFDYKILWKYVLQVCTHDDNTITAQAFFNTYEEALDTGIRTALAFINR